MPGDRKPLTANSKVPSKLMVSCPIKEIAIGHRTIRPTLVIIKLMLKELELAELRLTRITEKAEVIAARRASKTPIIILIEESFKVNKATQNNPYFRKTTLNNMYFVIPVS